MSVFHLDLEIDSGAYPELHQMLTTLENASFRAERVRQLASAGLVWERLRLASDALRAVGVAEASPTVPRMELVSGAVPSRSDPLALPVLRDEVPVTRLAHAEDSDHIGVPEGLPLAERTRSTTPLVSIVTGMDTAPSVQMSGARSRLMRMKRRGLFTNE